MLEKNQKKIENLEAELSPSLKYKKLDIFVGIFQILLVVALFAGAIAVALFAGAVAFLTI